MLESPAPTPTPKGAALAAAGLPPRHGMPVSDRSSDVLGYDHNPLDAFFEPASVAVIGAT